MKTVLSPRELAHAVGVSESSLRRWVDSGAIRTYRTMGGHRKIPLAEAIRFIKETHCTLARPELLGLVNLPDLKDQETQNSHADHIYQYLESGDEAAFRGLLTSLYLSGQSIAALCDGPIRSAMTKLGDLWKCNQAGILIEHRATEIVIRTMHQLRQTLPQPADDAPIAIGGAPEGDPYMIPATMVSLVLSEAGFSDINFGANTPVRLFAEAAREYRAKLVWLSITSIENKPRLEEAIQSMCAELQALNIPLVLGGRLVHDLKLPRHCNPIQVEGMVEFTAFCRGLAMTTIPKHVADPANQTIQPIES